MLEKEPARLLNPSGLSSLWAAARKRAACAKLTNET